MQPQSGLLLISAQSPSESTEAIEVDDVESHGSHPAMNYRMESARGLPLITVQRPEVDLQDTCFWVVEDFRLPQNVVDIRTLPHILHPLPMPPMQQPMVRIQSMRAKECVHR